MRAIIISEEDLEKILEETRKELELTKFRVQSNQNIITADDMHRAFNYWLCDMVNRIRDAK